MIEEQEQGSEAISFFTALSLVLGWTYFTLWSVSFYPQILTNFRRKTTAGFSPDFLLANIFGFTSYTLYAGLLLFSPTVRHEYADRHSGKPPAVQLNDFAFGVHAVAVELIVLSQFLLPRLWGIQDRARLPVSWAMGGICTACTAWLVIQCVARGPGLDFVYTLGSVKLLLTLLKCAPQAWLNYRRKSTAGFAFSAILMDLGGSVFSLCQLFIDAALQGSWRGAMGGNPTKFVLGNLSLLFDAVFMWQRYVAYGEAKVKGEEGDEGVRTALLREGV